ncbi:MAG: lysylphosphatidylglycerol synthase transmembrane domain-containing protein [Methanimicrococcus sp.]|nr:lysylphosphatidylglycerol synthase transmembrane domain-containing protein [Methanimicrococcus sp.]
MVNYKKLFFISLTISILSAVAIIFLTTDAGTIESLKQIRVEYMILALGVQFLSYVLTARKTKFLLRSLGYHIRTRQALENVLTGILLASLTPASVGGEPVRILLLRKNTNVPVGKATAVIFMERFLDALFIFSALLPSLFILKSFLSKEHGIWGVDTLLFIGIISLFFLLLILVYTILHPEFAKKISRKILIFAEKKAPEKHKSKINKMILISENEVDLFHSSFKRFVSVGKLNLLIAIFYTVSYWLIRYSILWLILLGLNVQPDLKLLFAAQVVLSIIMTIPATPGASGITEIAAYALYSLFVPSSLIGVTVIAWRAVTYYVNIIVGFLAGLKVIRKYGVNAFGSSPAETDVLKPD